MMEPSSVRYRTCCHNLQRAFCKDRKKVPRKEKYIKFYYILQSKFSHKESQSKLYNCAFRLFWRHEGVLGSEGMSLCILNLNIIWRRASRNACLTPGGWALGTNWLSGGWVSEPIWTFLSREKSLPPNGNRSTQPSD